VPRSSRSPRQPTGVHVALVRAALIQARQLRALSSTSHLAARRRGTPRKDDT